MLNQRDYFAELFVAGLFADNGWNIYFPHRDEGFDFIVSKTIKNEVIIKPVQVKSKSPTANKKDKPVYGYVGELTKLHNDMTLVIPFFNNTKSITIEIELVAFMPFSMIKTHSKGHKCEPATFKNGKAQPRREFKKYFGEEGLSLLEGNTPL